MDSIKNFFSQIDGRIFDFNFSNLSNKDYLLNTKPESFYFQSWALVLVVLGIVFAVLSLIFLKKRRGILLIEKEKRHILSFHTKINLVFISLSFVLIFLRTQGTQYLSMRLLVWLCLAFVVISSITAVIRLLIYKPEGEFLEVIKSDDTYQKYLPKKKKKK
jgi:E3 ubiquitin-protein ligase DOA10